MPVNRLTRDNILIQALDMADLPELDQHDRPTAGTIDSGAFSINWFQRCLDEVHQEFPWSGTVTSAGGTISALNRTLPDPTEGADHFYARAVKPWPPWYDERYITVRIGRHDFLKLGGF